MGKLLKIGSFLAIAGFPLSVLGTRLGLFDFRTGFTGVRFTVYVSVAVFLVGLVVWFWKRKSSPADSKLALVATLISLIPLLGIGSQMVTARSVPPIHNISTDTVNPPQFDKIKSIREAKSNSLEYDADKLAEIQTKAYPEVTTILSVLSKEEALNRSIGVAQNLGWDIINEDVEEGILEATETTALWGFKDDVVIRVTAHEAGVAIDLRSVSRVGQSDLGANARRIKAFIDGFTD